MKKVFGLALLCSLAIASCDKVEVPVPEPEVPVNVDSISFPPIDSAAINTTTKRVLVEEFTGHQCTACPTSTEQLLAQQKAAGDEIIVVSLHAGVFSPVKLPDYPTEFRTPHGNKLDTLYMSGFGYPSVVTNRFKTNGQITVKTSFIQWEQPIADQLGQLAELGLGLEADYIADSNAFAISVAGTAVNTISGEHRLVILCLEDSVVAPQKDQRLDNDVYPNKINTEYVHKHVVRGQLNSSSGLFGEVVIPAVLAAGEWFGGEYYYQVPDNVLDATKCSIVAYIINSSTEEIIQSEEVHVHTVESE